MQRTMMRFPDATLALVVAVGILLTSCNSDDPTVVPPADTCDDQTAGGFTISDPQPGRVYVWGGTGRSGAGETGHAPGSTSLYWPVDICFDPAGKPVVLDWNNHRVLSLDAGGNFEKIIGGGFGQPADGPALDARLNHPTHVSFSPDGSKLVLSAWHNSIVMEMDLATGWIARTCGTGGRCFNMETDPLLACLDLPVCTAFHPITQEMYISDQANHVIRRIDYAGHIQIVAGTAPIPGVCSPCEDLQRLWCRQVGYEGDGGPATSARLHFECTQSANPSGRICFDADGNLYIADTANNAIRVIHAADQTIDTFAGMGPGAEGYAGDGGLATDARLNKPRDIAIDQGGNLFIADTGNHVIRMVDTNGIISTVVGVFRPTEADKLTKTYKNSGQVPTISACSLRDEQGTPALQVHLTAPYGIELDAQGNLWIADTYNSVIRILYR